MSDCLPVEDQRSLHTDRGLVIEQLPSLQDKPPSLPGLHPTSHLQEVAGLLQWFLRNSRHTQRVILGSRAVCYRAWLPQEVVTCCV